MPTFSCSSVARETVQDLAVSLHARHNLVAGSASQNVLKVKGRIPGSVDVILGSDLVFSLTGTIDSAEVAGGTVKQSAVAKLILDYFRRNSQQLGLSTVTDIYIDEDDGRAKFSVTSSRPLRHTSQSAFVQLISVDLILACKSSTRDGETLMEGKYPFASQVYLPILSALDHLVQTFVVFHLVRRYPLIFGPWRAKFDLEEALFPNIARSIHNIVQRSTNQSFRNKSRRILETLEQQLSLSTAQSVNTLYAYLGDGSVEEETDLNASLGRDDVLSQSLEQLFRHVIRPTRFKGSSLQPTAAVPEDDERIFDPPERDISSRDSALPGSVYDAILADGNEEEDLDDAPVELICDPDDPAIDHDWDDYWLWDLPDAQELDDDNCRSMMDEEACLFYRSITTSQDSRDSQTSFDSDDSINTPASSQLDVYCTSSAYHPCLSDNSDYQILDITDEDEYACLDFAGSAKVPDSVPEYLSEAQCADSHTTPWVPMPMDDFDILESSLDNEDKHHLLFADSDDELAEAPKIICPVPTHGLPRSPHVLDCSDDDEDELLGGQHSASQLMDHWF